MEETVVGRTDATVVRVQTFGGEAEGYRIVAHGFPTFTPGERLLVFLGPEADGVHHVVGYQLGQYRVEKDRRGAEVAVPALAGGALLLDPQGKVAAPPRALALEELKEQVQRTARDLSRNQR